MLYENNCDALTYRASPATWTRLTGLSITDERRKGGSFDHSSTAMMQKNCSIGRSVLLLLPKLFLCALSLSLCTSVYCPPTTPLQSNSCALTCLGSMHDSS